MPPGSNHAPAEHADASTPAPPTGAMVQAFLAQNAAWAERSIDAFCEASKGISSRFPFEPRGTRDAAVFLQGRVDWHAAPGEPPRIGQLHLPAGLLEKVRDPSWLTLLSEADVEDLDFSWMEQLEQFDTWTLFGAGLDERRWIPAFVWPVPDQRVLRDWARLRRFASVVRWRRGDRLDHPIAQAQIRHLASLIASLGISVAIAAAGQVLELASPAAQMTPPEDPTVLASLIREGGRFMLPGVPPALRTRALGCSAFQCAMRMNEAESRSSLRPWVDPITDKVETRDSGCDDRLLAWVEALPPLPAEQIPEVFEALTREPRRRSWSNFPSPTSR